LSFRIQTKLLDLLGFSSAESGPIGFSLLTSGSREASATPTNAGMSRRNMTVTIYHNPNCGTSRNTLAMIRKSGEEPVVIEYLKTPRRASG
jgi:hypothetical protein